MSEAVQYPPPKYSNKVDDSELYVDHHPQNQQTSFMQRSKQRIDHGLELLSAKLRSMFDRSTQPTSQAGIVRQQLRDVGFSGFDLLKPETRYLAKVLHEDEAILGAVIGRLRDSSIALMAVTNLRVLYINQIPLFTNIDELNYGVVTGVSMSGGRFDLDTTVTLHTGIGDYTLHSVNTNAAQKFIDAVESVAVDSKAALP